MGAKRALGRWSWRQLQREWRQQLLVLGLITISLTIASILGTLLYHAEQPSSAFTGTATHRLHIFPSDSQSLSDRLSDVEEAFPESEISLSRFGRRDGSNLEIEITTIAPEPLFGSEPVRTLSGQRPQTNGELALSSRLASANRLGIGDQVSIDQLPFTIVGIVEDPAFLQRPFALASTLSEVDADFATVHLKAADVDVQNFNADDTGHIDFSNTERLYIDAVRRVVPMTAALTITAIALLEIALLCSAGFVVLAQRRVQQFGLLGAIGASPKHLRTALRLNGALLGLTGGTIGVAAGFGIGLAARPLFEDLLGHRITTWSMPWIILAPLVLLASATGLLAAWWPSRTLYKSSIVDALAGRPPKRSSSARWIWTGLPCFVAGTISLTMATRSNNGKLAAASLIIAIAGLLASTPALAAAGGWLATQLPVGPRIALRDLARHPNRSGAALASLVVALAIPTAITVTSASADVGLDRTGPNLPDNWAAVMTAGALGGHVAPITERADQTLTDLMKILPLATITEIKLAVPPGSDQSLFVSRCHGDEIEWSCTSGVGDQPWVATPEILAALGIERSIAFEDALLVSDKDEAISVNLGFEVAPVDVVPQLRKLTPYSSIPNYFVPESSLDEAKLEAISVGWLLTNPSTISRQEAEALLQAASSEQTLRGNPLTALRVEVEQPNQDDSDTRRTTTIVGIVLALAVIASMTRLVWLDSDDADKTMVAVGASTKTRRMLAASTTAFLSIAGAALALAAGYLALLAITSDQSANFPFVFPAAELGALLIGTPLVATLTSAVMTRNTNPNA